MDQDLSSSSQLTWLSAAPTSITKIFITYQHPSLATILIGIHAVGKEEQSELRIVFEDSDLYPILLETFSHAINSLSLGWPKHAQPNWANYFCTISVALLHVNDTDMIR